MVRWSITPAGTVGRADIDQDGVGDAEVARCIRTAVLRWRFPSPGPSTIEVSFPFVFQASS